MFDGGCACGALRYVAHDLDPAWFCHCRACQRASGAPVMAWASTGHLETHGDPRTFADPPHGDRVFCPTCGTAPLRRVGAGWLVAVATLDAPDAARPSIHVGIDAQRPWLKTWDGLARVEGTGVPEPVPASWRSVRDPDLDRSSPVTLRAVDDDNRRAIICLMVSGPQMRFVAPNALSLMQEQATHEETWMRAVYAGEVPVGLVLVEFPTEDALGLPLTGMPFLWRFMVDEHYQGLGYGARSMTLLFDAMRDLGHPTLFVSAVPGAGSPIPFYERLGFVQTGVCDEGEDILQLELTPPAI